MSEVDKIMWVWYSIFLVVGVLFGIGVVTVIRWIF